MNAKSLHIGGFVPLTTIDYPEHLAAVVFLQGCPWRCRYCHNGNLLTFQEPSSYSWEKIVSFLENRRNLLQAVVFSGGEPTLQLGLGAAIKQVKQMGFLVGLHTGGMFPERIKAFLSDIDWVGLDIKNLPNKYKDITRTVNSGDKIEQTLNLLCENNISFECRTTYHSDLIDLQTLFSLGEYLKNKGVTHYALQVCQTENVLDKTLPANYISSDDKKKIHDKFNALFPHFIYRDTS